MTLVIRSGTLGDLPQVLDIYNSLGLEHEAVLTLTDIEKWFAQTQQYPSCTGSLYDRKNCGYIARH
ncbi:MAG: hypothetical protein AAFR24_08655 [Cyanobacteria bacterium J06627_3]